MRDMMYNCSARSDIWRSSLGGWQENSTVSLLHAACHCHSPACMHQELWNLDTGELLCRQTPQYGRGVQP